MNKISWLLSILIIPTITLRLNSQSVEIERGEFFKYRKQHFNRFLRSTDQEFYTFGGKRSLAHKNFIKKKYYFKKYRIEDFKLLDEVYLGKEIEVDGKSLDFVEVVHFKDYALILFRFFDKDNDLQLIYGQKFTNLENYSSPQKLLEVPSDKGYYRNVEFKMSNDSSHFLISSISRNLEKDAQPPVLALFNDQLENIWFKNDNFGSFDDEKFLINNIKITAKRNEILLHGYATNKGIWKNYAKKMKRLLTDDEDKISPVVLGGHKVFLYTKNNDVVSVNLNDYNKAFHNVSVFTHDEIVLLAGFYSDSTQRIADGVFSIVLEASNLRELHSSFMKFEDSFLEGYSQDPGQFENFLLKLSGMKKFMPEDLERFKFKDLLLMSDGSYRIIGEQDYVIRVIRGADGNNWTNYANQILVIKIKPNGDIDWLNYLPKKQQFYNPYSGNYFPPNSYLLHQMNDTLNFLFQDHGDNVQLRKDGEELKTFGHSLSNHTISRFKLYPDGQFDYEPISHGKETKDLMSFSTYFKINQNTYLIELYRYLIPQQGRFGKIYFY